MNTREIVQEHQWITGSRTIKEVPIGVSNRHVHLTKEHIQELFGYSELVLMKALSQPGQFAAQEAVSIIGPEKAGKRKNISNVRVLGPDRPATQVEISLTDVRALGIHDVPVRLSGVLEGTPGIILEGPKGSIDISSGVIVAQKHLHIEPRRAKERNLEDGQSITVGVPGEIRGGLLTKVIVRISDSAQLDLHVDTDEGNALQIVPGTTGLILNNEEILDFLHSDYLNIHNAQDGHTRN